MMNQTEQMREALRLIQMNSSDAELVHEWASEALKSTAPDDIPHNIIQLSQIILSDCGCSPENESLVERVARRIADVLFVSEGMPTTSQITQWANKHGRNVDWPLVIWLMQQKALAAKPAPKVLLNGLTQKETEQSASCFGLLRKPTKLVRLTQEELDNLEALHIRLYRGVTDAWIEGIEDFAHAIMDKMEQLNGGNENE